MRDSMDGLAITTVLSFDDMARDLNRQNTERLIDSLRERISKLDRVQRKAMKADACVTLNKQQARDYEERAQGLSELRRELLDLVRVHK